MRARDFFAGLIFILIASLFSVYSIWLVTARPDDVYIYYRFAQNLANGHGIVFNIGDRVEGVTSLLWTGVLALEDRCGLPLEVAAPYLSLLCGIFVLWRLPFVSAKLRGGAGIVLADLYAPLWVASTVSFAYWSFSGMETALFSLCLLLIVELLLDKSRYSLYWSAIVTALTVLVRPEILIAIPCIFLYVLSRFGHEKRAAMFWGALVALIVGSIFLCRFLYFGDWLPNTYYAKHDLSLSSITRGLLYAVQFLVSLFPVSASVSINLCIAIIAFATFGFCGRKYPSVLLLNLLIASLTAGVVFDGADWMILHRLLTPLIPIITLALCSVLLSKIPSRLGFVLIFVVVGLNIREGYFERSDIRGQLRPVNNTDPQYGPLIEYLNQHARKDDKLALMDVGEIGFKTGMNIIDISGLVDKKIAHAPGGFLTKEYPPAWILDQRPRWIALRKDWDPIDARIFHDERFQKHYVQIIEVIKPTQMALYELTTKE